MTDTSDPMRWQAQWIGHPDRCQNDWRSPVLPAPLVRCEFLLAGPVKSARLRICGLGYYELHINGAKVGDHVLDPVVTQYDRRVRYVTYDPSPHLKCGTNAIGVILGNGWYNCHTAEAWHFDKVSWRDNPKLLLQLDVTLEDKTRVTLCSDTAWRIGDGPIRFDGLRNGETYDAREERAGWSEPGYDDAAWTTAVVVPAPGGVLQEQVCPPCRVMQTLSPVSMQTPRSGVVVYDLGQSMAGWAQLHVSGDAGTEITLRYAECLVENGEIDQSNIAGLVYSEHYQTDRYILKGGESESWEPRFTYHGFRYVQVEGLPGTPTLDNIRGQVVHTSFDPLGTFECSAPDMNRLQACTRWAYIGNFVGIPTDCPHREKNGWTGDAQLAAETGLMNYDAASSYGQWLESMADTQRPSGQFPGIVPSGGWGHNWGSGPAWDSAFILLPWYIYLYTGDTTAIEQHYDGIKRYVDFCTSMATDHMVSFGLGDWCPVDAAHMPPVALTSTAYYYVDARLLATFAMLTGHDADAETYGALADQIRHALNTRFYRGNGIYANGEMTALGCALYQGFVEDTERPTVVERLVEAVEANGCKPDFGILGAKYVPRALADNGHVALAYRLIAQPEFPGWVHWLRQGATTLWENWSGDGSRNHIMFGDVSAWMYQYLAGISPDPETPGFKHVLLRPHAVPGLDWVTATHRLSSGVCRSAWTRRGGAVDFEIELPPGVTGSLTLPGGVPQALTAGRHAFLIEDHQSP